MTTPDGLPTLSRGWHKPGDGRACVMEMVSLLAGEEWSDRPACTHPMLAEAARTVNDSLSDSERHLLVPLIGRLFGSSGAIDEEALACWMANSVDAPYRYSFEINLGRAIGEWLLVAKFVALVAAAQPPRYEAVPVDWTRIDWTQPTQHLDLPITVREVSTAQRAVQWLSALIDEYDRLSGRTEHRDVTDAELRDLAAAVTA